MTRRALTALLALMIATTSASAWAESEDEKRIINGPTKTSFGGLELVLGQGASAETAFQPDASKLIVKTLVGEARIVTSARNLIMVESTDGRVEILLPNGRLIVVESGKVEIVGRALIDDPGNLTIRLSGTGPIAQAAGTPDFMSTTAGVSILNSTQPSTIDQQLSNRELHPRRLRELHHPVDLRSFETNPIRAAVRRGQTAAATSRP